MNVIEKRIAVLETVKSAIERVDTMYIYSGDEESIKAVKEDTRNAIVKYLEKFPFESCVNGKDNDF